MAASRGVADQRSRELECQAGIGLRHPHVVALIEQPPPGLAWVEVHTENYTADGGPRLRQLELIRERYALSFHGVGLSLGSAEPPDPATSAASAASLTASRRRCCPSISRGASRAGTT